MNKNIIKLSLLATFAIILSISLAPIKANAITFNPLNPIDPFCLFTCDDDDDDAPQTVYNTNSNNVDSYNNTTINNPVTNNDPSTVAYNGTVYNGGIYEPRQTVYEYDYNYYNPPQTYYPPTPTYIYNPPVYNYYSPINVTCSANVNYTNTGVNVSWRAYASGGNGNYSYSWSGTDGLYGSSNVANIYYNTSGTKSASVTVYSNNSQTTAYCSNIVVSNPNYYYNNNYTYNPQVIYNTNDIQIACFADKTSTTIGTPVTWATEVYPVNQNYTYAWTGTDGVSGNQGTLITTYVSSGSKSAIVTVSANGISRSKACGNTVSVKSNVVAKPAPTVKATVAPIEKEPVKADINELSAASLFSLKGVPWGWVAILVILVLFSTVVYLLVNRNKM